MRLTKSNLAKVVYPAGKAEHILYDDDVAGFGIRMHPGGRRTWFVQYRIGAKQRRFKLGTTDNLDADEARRRARAALAKAELGQDPQADKALAAAPPAAPLGMVAERYLTGYAAKRLKPRSLLEVERHLRKHWSPLASVGISALTRAKVSAHLAKIASENGPFAANRARAALSALYSWAIGEGLTDNNPVVGTHRPTEEVSRDRVLTDPELRLVWVNAGLGDFGSILRLLILTGARRQEVGGMLWSELDGSMWTIGGDRSKNHMPNPLPLSGRAMAVIAAHPRRDGRDLAFGTRAGPFQGWSNAKELLDARIRDAVKRDRGTIPPDWRVHDIRRTVATRMGDLGVQPHVIEAVLGHISGFRAGVAGTYNRSAYLPEKRAALALWADYVEKLVGQVP